MAKITVKNWKNEAVGSFELDEAFTGYPLREHLIYEAVCAYRAGGRAGTHSTKNRSEVSGGTRKLWRQKHTGRARMGDNRSPIWRHGGTVHGPQPRDYSWKLPKAMRRNALKSVLAQKLRDGKLVCLDRFQLPTHRTAELEKVVAEGLGLHGKVLLMPFESERNLELAARNNPRVKVVRALGASIVDLLDNDTVVVTEPALRKLAEVLTR